jgi:hypothetical protein
MTNTGKTIHLLYPETLLDKYSFLKISTMYFLTTSYCTSISSSVSALTKASYILEGKMSLNANKFLCDKNSTLWNY